MKPEARHERLERSVLYVVSDAREERGDLAAFLEAILDAGVDIIQLREKEAAPDDLLRWGPVFRDAAERHDALFVLNDHPKLARVLEADGVHVGQDDASPAECREILGPDAIVGLSTHSPGQWEAAPEEASYLCAGPVWETPTKPGRPASGLEYVRHAAESGEGRPWFAIGGIDGGNLAQVLEAGATRIVVVRAVTHAPDPASAAELLRDALQSA